MGSKDEQEKAKFVIVFFLTFMKTVIPSNISCLLSCYRQSYDEKEQ